LNRPRPNVGSRFGSTTAGTAVTQCWVALWLDHRPRGRDPTLGRVSVPRNLRGRAVGSFWGRPESLGAEPSPLLLLRSPGLALKTASRGVPDATYMGVMGGCGWQL